MLSVSPFVQKKSTKVLVVDGQDASRNLLSSILNDLAIEDVCSLVGYQDFKSHFLSFLPDLLILDIDLPCGSAESVIEWTRLQPHGYLVPIIVTARNPGECISSALEKGANDYIQAPFIAAQIAVRINNVMQFSLSAYDASNDERFLDERLQFGIKALQSEISQRNQAEQELHFQAHHEYHSRLPNRVFFQKMLEELLAGSNNDPLENTTLAVFHLHQFNEINNTLGHSRADEILVEMALRFSALCQRYTEILPLQYGRYDQSGRVALLDRTHFAIVLTGAQAYRLEKIIAQILTDSSQPFQYQGMQIETPIAVGFAPVLSNDNVTAWMRRAHVALEFSEQEKQPWAGYSEQADRYSKKKLTLVADLRNAIASDQGLFLHYQPQFNCQDGEVSGVEVLLRWNHPVYGALPADEIVALAEQTGLIQSLTHWVISHAFSQYQKVLAAGFQITLSINLSTLNLWQDNLLDDISQQLEIYEIPASQLILEVTETVLLKKPKRSLEFLRCLTALGIRIALDDFGTGFSSLAYLKKMPVSELKIDRSFIQELCYSHEDQVIVATIISMCQGLGVEVIAEGVEDRETQLMLETLGCDRLQGYFLAKPMLGTDLLSRLAHSDG
jgi:EAL domain-containing protein (putative c-di-GMP-specific phosphodiesterase class I)/GGDEF domain-containing protein/FixJ family two-component response regulator